MSRPTGIFVLGNHDAVVAGKMSPDVFNDSARRLILWTRDRIGPRGARFLQYLPEGGEYTLEFRAKSIGGRKIDCRVQMFDRMDTDPRRSRFSPWNPPRASWWPID